MGLRGRRFLPMPHSFPTSEHLHRLWGRRFRLPLEFLHFCENSQVVETLIWWGRRFRLPTLTNGRLPKETTAFPSRRCMAVPDLAAVGNSAGQWKCRRLPNSRTRFRGRRSCPGSSCIGPPLAAGPADCRSGLRYHFDRRLRKAFLSSLRLGSNAEPRAFADSPPSLCR